MSIIYRQAMGDVGWLQRGGDLWMDMRQTSFSLIFYMSFGDKIQRTI